MVVPLTVLAALAMVAALAVVEALVAEAAVTDVAAVVAVAVLAVAAVLAVVAEGVSSVLSKSWLNDAAWDCGVPVEEVWLPDVVEPPLALARTSLASFSRSAWICALLDAESLSPSSLLGGLPPP